MSKITYNIGNLRGTAPLADTRITESIANAVVTDSVAAARRDATARLGMLASRLQQTIETEYVEAVRYAANSMIGLSSRESKGGYMSIYIHPPGADQKVGIGIGRPNQMARVQAKTKGATISWKVLQQRTVQEKFRRTKNRTRAHQFFLDRGTLRRNLLSMARNMVKRTGSVKVTYRNAQYREGGRFAKITKATQRVKLAELEIRLMPRIPISMLPSLQTGNLSKTDPKLGFEQAMGIRGKNLEKLLGPAHDPSGDHHRPLLQPVFTYWTLYRIPGRIADAINRAI